MALQQAIAASIGKDFSSAISFWRTGLDYFGARYFSGAMGRFTSPDEPLRDQHPNDPQSWNLYAYGRNNPLRYSDPTGQCAVDGEEHGWLWCLAHDLKLVETEKEKADVARTFYELNPQYDQNGNLIDPTKMSNSEVLKAFHDLTYQRRDQLIAQGIASMGEAGATAYINLTDAQAQQHILEGDATGGGHRPGTGIPGKSEFPVTWSDGKILHEISDVATDPSSKRETQGRTKVITGTREGVTIRVIERDGRIVTGYPTNLPKNP